MNKVQQFNLPVGKLSIYDESPSFKIVSLLQIHSDNIVDFNPKDDFSKIEADGIRFDNSKALDFSFGIKTADCLPIIILGKEKSVFLHAGWRGIQKGILSNSKIKAIEPYFAFIGPSIQHDSFIVTEEFELNFPNSQNFSKKDNHLRFDLQKEALTQLKKAYSNIEIQDCAQCTFKLMKFNSYRRDKTSKRNWNIYSI